MKIKIEDIEYTLLIERKNIKNVILKVEENNLLKVSVNPLVDEKKIIEWIESKKAWISKASKQRESFHQKTKPLDLNRKKALFFGQLMDLEIIYAAKDELLVKEQLLIFKTKQKTVEKIQDAYELELKKLLNRKINEKRVLYDQMLEDYRLPLPAITIRKMTSKWGSCIPAKAKISINFMLVYYPIECLEYVLLHEFVHMIVPNHSQRFYQIIENKMPNYKAIQKILQGS